MKKQLIFTLFLFYNFHLLAQINAFKIKVSEGNNMPIVGANIILKEKKDTSRIQYGVTDTGGIAEFKFKTERQFILSASFIGFKPVQKTILVSPNDIYTLVMETQTELLKGVEILAKKPLITQEDDKTVVDAEQIALGATNAMEVMEKTPGLFIDQDGNIYISSATPANVYINGREQRMSNADIATMLKALPPNSIEKIEILRTPSAKYDANGNGGLVNVILKKGVKIGLTGSFNAGFNQGVYGNQFVGVNMSNNEGAKTSFFNLNYSRGENYSRVNNDRFLTSSTLNQYSYTPNSFNSLSSNFGLGREVNKKWSFNYDGRINYQLGNSQTLTESQVKATPNENIISNNTNNLDNKNNNFILNQGLASKYKIDTLGSEWTSDISLDFSKTNGGQDYTTRFFIPQVNSANGNGDWDNKRWTGMAQTDLKYKFPHNITLETGLKTSFLSFNSATQYYLNGSKDVFRTNTYSFKSNINAAYLQGSKKWGAFNLKIGARLENTNMQGQQTVPSDTSFDIHRTDVFPYAYLSRRIMSIKGIELRAYLVARRTITRPTYEQLNPFPRFLDQFLYEAGNPSLKPQFNQNYEVNVSAMEMPFLAFGKNYTQDIFTNVVYTDPKNNLVNYRTYDNLGKNTETYARITVGIPPGGKYFFVLGTQYNRNEYDGIYEGKPLSFTRGSWTFFTYHSLKLGKYTQFSMNGFMRLAGQMQFYELSDFGSLNLNINHQFLDRKLIVSLNFNDVFFTNQYRYTLNQGNIHAVGSRVNDSRRVGLNMRYLFGIRKKEKPENMFNMPEY